MTFSFLSSILISHVQAATEQLAIALHCCGEPKRSLKHFQTLLSHYDERSEGHTRIWNAIGCVQFHLGRATFAINCFNRVVHSPFATPMVKAIARANLGHAQLVHGMQYDSVESLRTALVVRETTKVCV